jgi:ABC-2 type transport system permease protein
MSAVTLRLRAGAVEARKLPAFIRRDLLIMLSYRAAFATDVLNIAVQALLFSFIGKLVDPAMLPAYGGTRATYLEFAAIGVVLSLVCALLLHRVSTAVREEQLMGTFEALLATPTSTATVQAGSVAFDLLFVPLRMAAMLLVVALFFGLSFEPSGIVPALAVVAMFIPFVWGLGLVSAAAMVTFRRGAGLLAAGVSLLGIASGAYFPLDLLPDWIQTMAEANPVAITIDAVREALIGGGGWSAISSEAVLLPALSILALGSGALAFRAALAREHRRGTLGLY